MIGGDAVAVDTLDRYIQADQMLVATLGVRNLVVVGRSHKYPDQGRSSGTGTGYRDI